MWQALRSFTWTCQLRPIPAYTLRVWVRSRRHKYYFNIRKWSGRTCQNIINSIQFSETSTSLLDSTSNDFLTGQQQRFLPFSCIFLERHHLDQEQTWLFKKESYLYRAHRLPLSQRLRGWCHVTEILPIVIMRYFVKHRQCTVQFRCNSHDGVERTNS